MSTPDQLTPFFDAAPPVSFGNPAWALVNRLIDRPDVVGRAETVIEAPVRLVFRSAREFDLHSVPLVHALFWARARFAHPDRIVWAKGGSLVGEARATGWGVLTETAERVVVFGAVGRPWIPQVNCWPLALDDFMAFAQPGAVKMLWTLEVEPLGAALTRLSTEMRIVATDDEARREFRRYWRLAGAGAVMIRWLSMRAIKRNVEDEFRLSRHRDVAERVHA